MLKYVTLILLIFFLILLASALQVFNLTSISMNDDSLELLNSSIKLNPNNATAWLAKAQCLSTNGDYNESIVCFKRAVEINPTDKNIWLCGARIFKKMNRLNDSVNAYDRAIDICPNSPKIYIEKGSNYEASKDYNNALIAYDKALLQDSSNINSWICKSRVLRLMGDYYGSLNASDIALEKWPNNRAAHIARAQTLWKMKKFYEAFQEYNEFINQSYYLSINKLDDLESLDPNNTSLLMQKAQILDDMGNYSESLNAYEKAIKLDPENKALWGAKAHVLSQLGEFNESLAAYEIANEVPEAQLMKTIVFKGFAANEVYPADINNDGLMEILCLQSPGADQSKLYDTFNEQSMVYCLTAINLSGRIVWQLGEPFLDSSNFISHCADQMVWCGFINNKTKPEIVGLNRTDLFVLDAATGKAKDSRSLDADNYVIVKYIHNPTFRINGLNAHEFFCY